MDETLNIKIMPVIAIKGHQLFPHCTLYFDAGRECSIKALESCESSGGYIFLTEQKDSYGNEPKLEDLYIYGTVARITQQLFMPGDGMKVVAEGVDRAKLCSLLNTVPYMTGEVMILPESEPDSAKASRDEAKKRILCEMYGKYNRMIAQRPQNEIQITPEKCTLGELTDVMAYNVRFTPDVKQEFLKETNVTARAKLMLLKMSTELKIAEAELKISMEVHDNIDFQQRDYYLREQIKAIKTELGDDEATSEIDKYREKARKCGLCGCEEAYAKFGEELDRLDKLPFGSQEANIIRNYLDWLIAVPWQKRSHINTDIKKAAAILEKDHYGLKDVKKRILEYLSVEILRRSSKNETRRSTIICLAGPPGVGKTSIAKSIAKAAGLKYVRMSLGGVNDEAEIRGHRRTYLGSMPGRIISAMKAAGTVNPLILMDELDKLGSDRKGDPASALLEVLDAEQNFAFRDHYMEVPVNLSEVLFVTTVNSLETVPPALLDRMEIIELSGYTDEEKFMIGKKYLVGRQIKESCLKRENIKIRDEAIYDIINYYTREAGVRGLEREIGSICRKAAQKLLSGEGKTFTVSSANLTEYLGNRKYRHENELISADEVGVARGLAWTAAGGETLDIEVALMKGSGKLELTGQLGDVMKESAMAAMSYIRSKSDKLGIDGDFHSSHDIHIHVPEGAVPKDGPSAGITLATAMISAITNVPVRNNVAMTGEITLRGRVLPIGGLKEKTLAAVRAGIDTVIIPEENIRDTDDISGDILSKIKVIPVKNIEQVLDVALHN